MSSAVKTVEDQKTAFLKQFTGRVQNSLPMQALGKEARAALQQLSLPNRKTEAWKYTPVAPLLKAVFASAATTPPDIAAVSYPRPDAMEIYIVNGTISESMPDPGQGIVAGSLSDAMEQHGAMIRSQLGSLAEHKLEIFAALNTAHAQDGLFIWVPDHVQLSKPFHIIHINHGAAIASPRHLIAAGKNSLVRVIMSYVSADGQGFSNSVTEITAAEDAQVDLSLVQDDGGYLVHQTWLSQALRSQCGVHTITTDGKLVRNNVQVLLNGEHCETHLNGIYLGRGGMHIDNHTVVDHRMPNCVSDELYKGILNDKSTGVFNGKVFVRPHAQKTNAFQSNRNILLSEHATINSKPELEIYADDVKCSHGSTTGRLDQEALFYLRSRGLGEVSARKLLLQAFAEEVLERMPVEEAREFARDKLSLL